MRLKTVLVDVSFGLAQARQQFAQSAKHAAAHGLAEIGDALRTVAASADSELEAAERITGISLTTVGKLAELRARVRVVGKLNKETAFYTSSK